MSKTTFTLLSMLLMGWCASGRQVSAGILYGVTGDGASVSETLYTISTVDASATFVQSLGNGNDGESIAFNTSDGLMYHWSGFSNDFSQIMETVNLSDETVTDVGWSGYDFQEVFGSTYDASTGNFYTTDINQSLAVVTEAGVFSLVDSLDALYRGITFLGGDLYVGDRDSNLLSNVDKGTAAINSSVNVMMSGFSVNGINSLTTDTSTGTVYGILKTNAGRRLATIDVLTGAATDIGRFSDSFSNIEFVNDAAPIPEPSTLALFAIGGLVGVAGIRRRGKVERA